MINIKELNINLLEIINNIIQGAHILIFLHLVKYSRRNINMSYYDYILFLFPYIYSDFCFMYVCFFVVNVSNGL